VIHHPAFRGKSITFKEFVCANFLPPLRWQNGC
jgi:hypothetical protein